MTLTPHILPQTNQRDLVVHGEPLFREESSRFKQRGYQLLILKTAAGSYLAHVGYTSLWKTEREGYFFVIDRATLREVFDELRAWDCTSKVRLRPEYNDHLREKNHALNEDTKDILRTLWTALVDHASRALEHDADQLVEVSMLLAPTALVARARAALAPDETLEQFVQLALETELHKRSI